MWPFRRRERWTVVGQLEGKPDVRAVVASPGGFGVIGTGKTHAQLVRVDSAAVKVVYEGAGYIVALDHAEPHTVAIAGTLKAAGAGSSYRLLFSRDRGEHWEERGPVPALSVAQVLVRTPAEVWAIGAKTLVRTIDGGDTWRPVELDGERNSLEERLVRNRGEVAIVGANIATTADGTRWNAETTGGAFIHDLDGDHVLARHDDGKTVVGRRDGRGAPQWIATLPGDRLPLRLVVAGATIRVLSRHFDGARGADIRLHRSDGRRWTHRWLGVSPVVDIAGANVGVGVDIARRIKTTGLAT